VDASGSPSPLKHLHVDMTTDQFLAKLVALVPPPAFHMIRYAGVFSNHHHLRPLINPTSNTLLLAPIQLPLFGQPQDLSSPALPTPFPEVASFGLACSLASSPSTS